ncbi:hypothetical protein Dimus_020366, partial [Dionaea muscipula]
KKWVLATINGSWRRHKTLIKKKYYKPYDNDKERLLNRPKGIPEEQFKGFIEMVGSKKYKKIARSNKRCRKKQKNMHTTGRTSFACVRNEQQQANANKEPPTIVKMFTKTRKRVATLELKWSSYKHNKARIVAQVIRSVLL